MSEAEKTGDARGVEIWVHHDWMAERTVSAADETVAAFKRRIDRQLMLGVRPEDQLFFLGPFPDGDQVAYADDTTMAQTDLDGFCLWVHDADDWGDEGETWTDEEAAALRAKHRCNPDHRCRRAMLVKRSE
jgi:hypothetical protein